MTLQDRLDRHWNEAHNPSCKAYGSLKNVYIRASEPIKGKTLFHVDSPAVELYELACIQILSEIYELANVRKQMHSYYGWDEYKKIVLETHEKLQEYFALPYDPSDDVYPHEDDYLKRRYRPRTRGECGKPQPPPPV